jgi:hypothetical protein
MPRVSNWSNWRGGPPDVSRDIHKTASDDVLNGRYPSNALNASLTIRARWWPYDTGLTNMTTRDFDLYDNSIRYQPDGDIFNDRISGLTVSK